MRTRYLKPGFYENEYLAALPAVTRLLYAGLWLIADRKGRLLDRPARIKGELFPYDATPVEKHLSALATAGFIIRYEAEGKKLIWIPTFLLHQNPHRKEAPSALPCHPQEQSIAATLHLPKDDLGQAEEQAEGEPRDSPKSSPKSSPRDRAEPGGEWGMGNGELDPSNLIQGEGGDHVPSVHRAPGARTATANGPSPSPSPSADPSGLGARPSPSPIPSGLEWDWLRELYTQSIGELDDKARQTMKGWLGDGVDPSWIAAAINQATGAKEPGFGYVKRTIENCVKNRAPPSSLTKTRRGR